MDRGADCRRVIYLSLKDRQGEERYVELPLGERPRNTQKGGLTVREHIDMFPRLLLVAFILLLTGACAQTQEPQTKEPQTKGPPETRLQLPFKVQIATSGDEACVTSLSSHVARELRGLKDVEIVDANPHFRIRIACHDLDRFKRDTGQLKSDQFRCDFQYLVSIVFSLAWNKAAPNKESEREDVLVHYPGWASNDAYDVAAKGLVEMFEVNCLELARKMIRDAGPPKQ